MAGVSPMMHGALASIRPILALLVASVVTSLGQTGLSRTLAGQACVHGAAIDCLTDRVVTSPAPAQQLTKSRTARPVPPGVEPTLWSRTSDPVVGRAAYVERAGATSGRESASRKALGVLVVSSKTDLPPPLV